MAQRTEKAAATYRFGRARRPYARDSSWHGKWIRAVFALRVRMSLMDLTCFKALSIAVEHLRMRRRAIHPKPADTAYYDLTKQNAFLVKSVFDGKGNYVYHRDCIHAAFGVSNQCLSRLRKSVQIETNSPTELVNKQEIFLRKVSLMLCSLETVNNQPECGLTHSLKMFQCSARSNLDIMEMLGKNPIVPKAII